MTIYAGELTQDDEKALQELVDHVEWLYSLGATTSEIAKAAWVQKNRVREARRGRVSPHSFSAQKLFALTEEDFNHDY